MVNVASIDALDGGQQMSLGRQKTLLLSAVLCWTAAYTSFFPASCIYTNRRTELGKGREGMGRMEKPEERKQELLRSWFLGSACSGYW